MSESATNPANILIVDDETEHAQVMCEALERIGHSCDVVYNLAEAQQKLQKEKYDVVVTDLLIVLKTVPAVLFSRGAH